MIHRSLIVAAILALLCGSLFAQGWPLVGSSDTPCNGACKDPSSKVVGFGDVFTRFTGRYIDSTATRDYQQPFRTARARFVRFSPDRTRIYPWIGEAVGVYDAETFISRLEAREPLVPVTVVPLSNNLWKLMPRELRPEEFLKWDQYFYAENGSPWTTGTADGQRRLWDIDGDDQGYIYIAYLIFGWGVVKDNHVNDGSMTVTASQHFDPADGDAVSIVALKASGTYYALTRNDRSRIWRLTSSRSVDGPPTFLPFNFDGAAKTADLSRIALLVGGQVRIYNSDDLVQGRGPIQTFSSSLTRGYTQVASDGVKIYAAGSAPSGLIIAVFTPNSSGGYTQQEFSTNNGLSPVSLQTTDAYIVLSGVNPAGLWDVLLFKMVGGQPQRVDFQNFFPRYYTSAPAGYSAPYPGSINIADAAVFKSKKTGKNYLIVCGLGLGDVYELKDPDSVSVDLPTPIGTPNARRLADGTAGTGPFYGDNLRFTARTAALAVGWNFNDGGPPILSAPTTYDHRYGNLLYAGAPNPDPLPAAFTATALTVTSSGTTTFTLQRPVPRFGLTGYKYLFKQPDASSAAPIVIGDSFFDASDGDIDGHYSLWTVDGIPSKSMPSSPGVAVSNPDQCGPHVLNFEGHYGANPQLLSVSPDYITQIQGFNYTVRPFAASIDFAAGSSGVTFNAAGKATTNTAVLSALQVASLRYTWSLVNSARAAVPTPNSPAPAPGTGIGSIPSWTIAKSYFSTPGNRVQLTVNSPTAPTDPPGKVGCAGMSTYTASTPPLNPPDPKVDPASCPGGGPTCTLTVLSQRANFDQTADHWTYQWAAAPSSFGAPSTTGQTFIPTFTKVGTYTISMTVSNDFATSLPLPQTVVITNSPPPCAQINPDVNVLIDYSGPGGCAPHAACSAGQDLKFNVVTWGYDLNCAAHTVQWDFGDNDNSQAKSDLAVTHRYAVASPTGSYNITAVVSNGAQTATLHATVMFGSVYQPPPQNTGCPPIQPSVNMSLAYTGLSSGCTYRGNTCSGTEKLAFEADPFGYSIACGTHVFTWSFSDGSNDRPVGQYVTHQLIGPGSFTASVSVSVNGGAPVSLSIPVTVGSGGSGGGPPQQPPDACPAIQPKVNMSVSYSGPSSGCTDRSGTCASTEQVNFEVDPFGYSLACGTHTFTWSFSDGSNQHPTGQYVMHQFRGGGNFTATVSIAVNGGTPVDMSVPVAVSGTPLNTRRRGSHH